MKPSLHILLFGCLLQPLAALAQPYCQPTYIEAGTFNDYIDGFVLGNINNVGSGATAAPGYANYTNGGLSTITTVAPGGTYTATITSGPGGSADSYTIWVDLDHDFTYEPNELLAQATTSGIGLQTTMVNVTIPANAASGYTSLRVMCANDVFPTDACGTYVYGETEGYTLVIDDGAPCIPMYEFGTVANDYIDGFQFNTINNVSSGAQDGWAYSDYRYSGPGYLTTVAPGGTYTATITAGAGDFVDHYVIWVDLDGDLSFEPNELLAQASASGFGEQTTTVNVTIPANAPTGYTSMRVMFVSLNAPSDPCGTYVFGETEDYTLVIDDGSPCIPVFGYQASEGDYVSSVQLEDLNWSVATTPPLWGYDDATATGAHLQADVTSQLTVTKGTFAGGNHLYVWIDWANDGFDALDLVGTQIVSGSGGTATFNVTPTGAPGYARMRVACTYAELDDACGAADYGHAVDFTLSIGRAGWPCYPLYASGTSAGDGIDSLVLGSHTYYGLLEFPYATAHVENEHRYDAGASDVIQIRSRAATPNSYTLLLDMNNDGDFNDPQELVGLLSSNEPDQLFNFTLIIPAICPPGQHWLRVRCHPGTAMLADPCQETGFGNMIDVLLVVEDPNGPCIPYSPEWTTEGDFIDGVQLGGAQNLGTGGPWGPAYSAYLSPAISVLAGVPDTLRITGGAYPGDSYSAWIDYNDDNDFDDANELLGWIGIADPYAVGELPFTVPNGTVPGNRRMRVRCSYGVVSDACATMTYGETEDYTVYIETSTGVTAATIADLRLLPTTDGVQLLTDASLIGNSYLLLDATGRTLATGRITADRTDLPMIDFAHGAYTVQVSNSDARQVKRFVW